MGGAIELDLLDLGWSLGIMAIAVALSNWQRLDLEGQLIVATGRSLFQLLAAPGLLAHGLEMANKPLSAMPFVSDDNYHLRDVS